ncbi:hypothetical protein [uncultured Clostridium sp.]|uniref:hypothetical protein n=1 Tax=uncultured Clostridium sp. TaxID=59620 RepID=UPI0028E39807|nr:hypothetical protein [uncultured Clostridium sp.]
MFLFKLVVAMMCLLMLGTGSLNLYNIIQFKDRKISGKKYFGKELWLRIRKYIILKSNTVNEGSLLIWEN